MSNEKPQLTITLTGRPPVRITKDDWPIIASAEDMNFDGQYDFQANRKATWKLIVRQHNDGRTIVYGIYDYGTNYQGSRGAEVRGGELTDCNDVQSVIAAIQRVAAHMESRVPEVDGYGKGVFPRLAHECIADLPAEELV